MAFVLAPLARLVYVSRRNASCSVVDVHEILGVARVRNAELGITGLLCFSGEFFLQALEGTPEAVNALYARILRDPRHEKVRLLSYDDAIEVQIFREWAMGYVHSLDLDPGVMLPFFPEGRFEPEEMDGVSALMFLATVGREHAGLAAAEVSRDISGPSPAP